MRAGATAAESYYPPWVNELAWANGSLGAQPTGAQTWVENNYTPWWQGRVAHPLLDYDASKLPTGGIRLDAAVNAELTAHRMLPGWAARKSPTGINNIYGFSPGSQTQESLTARSGQSAFFDLGVHPIPTLSADIGAELIGNYDERYWFPVNDENRLFKDGRHAKIIRAEAKYDNKTFMLRGFDGAPVWGWVAQNDLFNLLPEVRDVEYARRASGSVLPRGGEMRYRSRLGTWNLLGGSEIRWGYESSAYVKYDAPVMGKLEQSLVYRNENIPFRLESADERRWAVSYNASAAFSDRVQGHAGLLYEPFRLTRSYQEVDGDNHVSRKTTQTSDAFGGTVRAEIHPRRILDRMGLGYLYLGPVAGNKQQVDVNAAKTAWTDWTLSAVYEYRQPIRGPVPLLFEGPSSNPGALVASPRGPDDPFWVHWDNRKAHIASLTLVYDPTPGTPFFKYYPNTVEDWNLDPAEDAPWTASAQYRVAHYPTNTDRLYGYAEDRALEWDFLSQPGAFASKRPLSSATGLVRWRRDSWQVTADLSAGEALAGLSRVYSSTTTFYKSSTFYLSGGLAVDNGFLKLFGRYGKDQWGPLGYHAQFGWGYRHIYQAGLSAVFLKDAEAGFRFVGTRLNDYIGSDTGAFNEYQFFLTYHFGVQSNVGRKLAVLGKPIPRSLPEASVELSDQQLAPDGSGPVRSIMIHPQASATGGVLSWQLFIRNAQGETVRRWEGSGTPPAYVRWNGLGAEGQPLPRGPYRVALTAVDLYGNESTSPAQTVDIVSLAAPPATPSAPAVSTKAYSVTDTPEGLKVTLSTLVLFDIDRAELIGSAKDGLDQVVALLRAYPTNVLRISGHSDSQGSARYNQRLSERRAQAVADYLIRQGGVERSRISAVGYGKNRPIAGNATEEGRQQNRRVEIDILK